MSWEAITGDCIEAMRAMDERSVHAVVLDPFAGSGTTGAVAAAMGRDVVMVEVVPEYVALIERRMAGVTTLRQRYTNERVSRIPSLFGEGG